MVIAHVLSSFRVGGQERVALDLAAGQRARGHRVLAIALARPPEGPLAADLRGAGVVTRTVAKLGPTVDLTLPLRLALLLRRARAQVVHTHNPGPLIYGAAAARLAGATVVQTRHGVAFSSRRQPWLVRRASRLVAACAVVSQALADKLGPSGLGRPARLCVVENGVDLGRFRPDPEDRIDVRRALGLPPGALVLGTASRLVAAKNVAGLVRACGPLLGPDVRLVVAGDGPERERLDQLCARKRFVHLLGERHDVPRLLRSFDVFLLFSNGEGHPVSLLEAMATALPVVASRVGGIPGIVEDGATGLLVPSGDEAALTAALARLLDHPERLAEMGRRGRAAAADRFAAERMVDQYLALYARCRLAEGPWPALP